MATEEAIVRARIAALKSLLEMQGQQTGPRMPQRHASHTHAPHHRLVRHNSHAPPKRRTTSSAVSAPHSNPRHLTWTPSVSATPSVMQRSPTPALTKPPPYVPTTTDSKKRPMSSTTLSLEDGTYRKTGRGFKLRREDTLPKSALEVSAAIASTKQQQPSPPPSESPPPSLPSSSFPLPPTRPAKLHHPNPLVPPPRTELCLFYIKHGECRHKHACLFVHDSRTISICRAFLRGACPHDASTCKLSHSPDQHKMPDCAMFLKGLCSREGCLYRHVNVSRDAALCDAFSLRGYCADGPACRRKHEFAKGVPFGRGPKHSAHDASQVSETVDVAARDGAAAESVSLNLRPTIRFTPKVV